MSDPLERLLPRPSEPPSAELAAALRQRILRIEARAERRAMRGWHLAQLNLTRRIPPPPASPSHSRTETTVTGQVFIPYLTVGDARTAMDFYAEVFDAEVRGEPFEMDDGRIGHAEMAIGDQVLYLADEFPEMNLAQPKSIGASSVAVAINVDDCDKTYDAALAAGGTGERPPANQHGLRIAWFIDPWGHRWSPMSPETPGA